MRSSRIFKIIANICRLILACTFILSGFTKVVDPWGTALKVNEYLTIYGMEFLQPASMAFSIWLCGAELMMGCMLLFKVRIRLISIFALASMLFFTVLTLLSATVIPVEDCGCFGDAIRLTPWETFLKNLVLLPMAVVVWWRYRPDKVFAFKPVEIVLTCLFFFLSMALGTYCYRHLPLVDFLPYKVGVNIWQEMHASEAEAGEVETVLVYRNLETGRLREFSLEDTEWQDTTRWEWVDTRTESDSSPVRPIIGEFALHDAEGDRRAADGPRARVVPLRHLVRADAPRLRPAFGPAGRAGAGGRRAGRMPHARTPRRGDVACLRNGGRGALLQHRRLDDEDHAARRQRRGGARRRGHPR